MRTAAGGGLEVLFDPALDGRGWPGPLGESMASCGEAWLGPLGLLDRLELELGLGGPQSEPLEREIGLARSLMGSSGFWTRSLEADPLATARRLLSDRDLLAMYGWRGESASIRLGALWYATVDAAPGVPDRLNRLIAALGRQHVDLTTMRILEPIETLPPLWQYVITALQRTGVAVVESSLPLGISARDLGAARSRGFTPIGDGSLQLVRPQGPLAAAEEVAAVLAASPDLRGVVVVGPDAVLDGALSRHGLPRLGADAVAPGSCALVRLCIETAFHPMDAAYLHALMCIDPGPVPLGIGWRLASALGRFPGRGAIEWSTGLSEGLDALLTWVGTDVAADPDKRHKLETRLAALLEPVAATTLSLQQLEARMDVLAGWARGRVVTDPSLAELIGLADRLVTIAKLYGVDPISRTQLRRWCAELERPVVPGVAQELGLSSVSGPGAVLGPARTIIWWGFTRDRAPIAPRVRLSAEERAALAAAGVATPDSGTVMAHEARRWRRPLHMATDGLVLVCPATDERGEPAHLHPLWDELTAATSGSSTGSRLQSSRMTLSAERSQIGARRERVALRTLPLAMVAAKVPHSIPLRQPESASSIEKLLGCSLSYALHYPGLLRPGMSRGAARVTPLLYGNLTHFVLAQVFANGALAPELAASHAAAVIDAQLPNLAETLLLAAHQAERATVRRAIIASARAVAVLVERTGSTIRGVELPLEGTIGAANIVSRADLVLATPDHVIDFKWGRSTNWDALRTGAAVQLAIYAQLAGTGQIPTGAAYLILRDQQLLAARGTALPDATVPTAHSVAAILRGVQKALDDRARELAEGELIAPSAIEDAPRSQLVDGVLRLAPACTYCELDAICGRRGRG